MNVVAFRTLKEFWEKNPQAETPLRTWYAISTKAEWKGPPEVKTMFGTGVDFVGDNRAIFDIGGNKYRLIVRVSYKFKQVMVKFIGTHDEYNKINPETV